MADIWGKFLLVLVTLIMVNTSGHCAENPKTKQEDQPKKLPVIINKGYRITDQAQLGPQASIGRSERFLDGDMQAKAGGTYEDPQEKTAIDYKKISDLVKDVKENICSVNSGGSYEIWLRVEAGGSAVFASASAQTGIKAIINCPTGPTDKLE